ncbi:hypothetical protein [Corynebacterium kalidii]|jgi:hypothetical protein
MNWVFVAAVVLIVVTGVTVLRRRRPQPASGFPWFWVTFPVGVLGLVCTLGAHLSRFAGVDFPEHDIVGLSAPYPGYNEVIQFLSNEQFLKLRGPLDPAVYLWFFPVLAIVATAASVVAWRKGRV